MNQLRLCEAAKTPVSMCDQLAKYCTFAGSLHNAHESMEPKEDLCDDHLKDRITSLLGRYEVVEVLRIKMANSSNDKSPEEIREAAKKELEKIRKEKAEKRNDN